MLGAITLLLIYQLVGEVLARFFGLPIPGPVIGLALLFATLAIREQPIGELRETANGLLAHLSLLFVPAGTGVMVHFARLGDEWLAIAIALLASTAITIGVAALVLRALVARRGGFGEERAR